MSRDDVLGVFVFYKYERGVYLVGLIYRFASSSCWICWLLISDSSFTWAARVHGLHD